VEKSSTKSGKPVSLIRALVVDDNELVRTFIAHVLREAGYQTATAEDGIAARDYVLQAGAPDVVVTDESMPRMTGHEFAQWVRQQRPDIKVLFLTGYPGEALEDEMCLEKPCTMRALLQAVTALIGPADKELVSSEQSYGTAPGCC
jgi:CheY-like chemotaxis protein